MRFLLTALLFSALAAAQTRPIVLKAARMFDGRVMSSPGLLVLADGKILDVGSSARIPDNAEAIDLGDSTLLPGFIDAHTHLSGN